MSKPRDEEVTELIKLHNHEGLRFIVFDDGYGNGSTFTEADFASRASFESLFKCLSRIGPKSTLTLHVETRD